MGTDIHMGVEVFDRATGTWRNSGPIFESAYDWQWDEAAQEMRDRGENDPPFMTASPFEDRNYDVFAVLGNVRNYHGIEPISDGRGIPDDADPATVMLADGDHSATWVTLRELLDYDCYAPKTNTLVVPERTFLAMRKVGQSDPWHEDVARALGGHVGGCAWISGDGVVILTPTTYDDWVADGRPNIRIAKSRGLLSTRSRAIVPVVADTPPDVHVQIRWTTTVREDMPESFWKMVEALKRLVPEGGSPADVRLVMDFDS